MAAIAEVLYFAGERRVEVRSEPLPETRPGEARVKTLCSAISAGTEMLMYRGEMPEDLPLDASIRELGAKRNYPFKYGYCAVGEVVEVGDGADAGWVGRRVFAFQPHASQFVAALDDLMLCPAELETEEAAFLPNMETAVNLCLDGAPRLGEKAVVLGQGIVGLLTTALLARFPLKELIVFDAIEARRLAGLNCGAARSMDPKEPAQIEAAEAALAEGGNPGADLIFEVSGAPEALDLAIRLAGFRTRIIAGSWYGKKRAALDLGGAFHRNRVQLTSSQVSTIAPELSGRWNKARRFETAWEMIRAIRPARWVTHRFPLAEAGRAYEMLDRQPELALQVLFTYG